MNLDKVNLTVYATEFLSSAVYVLVGCLGCVVFKNIGTTQLQLSSIFFGVASAITVHTFGFNCGGEANPCITLAAYIRGYLTLPVVFITMILQYLGAAFGFAILTMLTPQPDIYDVEPGLCMVLPNSDLGLIQVFCVEFLLTMILIFGWCSLWEFRNSHERMTASLRLGLLTVLCSLTGGGLSGAALNPARYLIPALYHNAYDYVWLYLISEHLAAVIVAAFWTLVFDGVPALVITREHPPKGAALVRTLSSLLNLK